MTPRQRYNALLSQKVIQGLGKRNIQGFYCETRKEALEKVLQMIPKGSVVSWGGSATLHEVGLIDLLKNGEYTVLDASAGKNGAEKAAKAHEALTADYYLMSANAVSASGELVNMDGIGNRVAALAFGPKNVIVVAGINKVEQNLESAILRAKTRAAPMCMLPYDKGEITTFDELLCKAETAWSRLVITSMSVFKDRIKVILIGESFGF